MSTNEDNENSVSEVASNSAALQSEMDALLLGRIKVSYSVRSSGYRLHTSKAPTRSLSFWNGVHALFWGASSIWNACTCRISVWLASSNATPGNYRRQFVTFLRCKCARLRNPILVPSSVLTEKKKGNT